MENVVKHLKPNQILYKENDPSKELYIIKEGTISIYSTPKSGRPVELVRLRKGQLIGDLAFFDPVPRNASAKALTEVDVIEIPYLSVQKEFEGLTPCLKVMLNVLATQVKNFAREIRQLRSIKMSAASCEDQDMDILRYFGVILHAQSVCGDGRVKNSLVSLNDIRRLGTQLFMLPTSRIEPVLSVLADTSYFSWVLDKNDTQYFCISDLEVLKNINQSQSSYLDLNKPKLMNPSPDEITFVRAMVKACQEVEPNWKGNVCIPAEQITKLIEKRSNARNVVVVDRLLETGLPIEKITRDGHLALAYNKEDTLRLLPYWETISKLKSTKLETST